jgi:hypothetical protein
MPLFNVAFVVVCSVLLICDISETITVFFDIPFDYIRFTSHTFVMYTAHGARGGVVVEALRYKPEGRGIDSRYCH